MSMSYYSPPPTWYTTGYDRQAGGKHPTGMISCISVISHYISYYYRPQRSCGQGYVFTRVCDSVNRGGLRRTPPGDQGEPPPDQGEPPQDQGEPPWTRQTPLPGPRRTPPSPGRPPPPPRREEHCSIR